MISKEMTAAVRGSFGKGSMRRMRAAGKTPGVVYCDGKEALPLEFETKVLFNELVSIQGRNAVITLKIDNGSERKLDFTCAWITLYQRQGEKWLRLAEVSNFK